MTKLLEKLNEASSVTDFLFVQPNYRYRLFLPGLPGGGNIIYDRSIYANHGTITGAVWGKLPSGLPYLDYDGNDDYVTIGTNLTAFKLTTFWYHCWVKLDVINQAQNLFATYDIAGGQEYGYLLRADSSADRVILRLSNGAANLNSCVGATPIVVSTWYCVDFVNASNVSHLIYLNGALEKSDTTDFTVSFTGTASKTLLGCAFRSDTSTYTGDLDGGQTLSSFMSVVPTDVATQVAQRYQQERHLIGV